MINDSFIQRIKLKARANQLCIAIGSLISGTCDLPTIAEEIKAQFGVKFAVKDRYEWFLKWNEFIAFTEKTTSRDDIISFVRKKVESE